MKNNRNYGLDIGREYIEQSKEDLILGAWSLPDEARIPESEREKYLPKGEVQKGVEDFMDCVTRGHNNIIETKLNYLLKNKKLRWENEMWLKKNGYITNNGVELSDRFTAILSNTTRSGNSLKAPAQAIHEFGCIPKSELPATKDMTWDEYHDISQVTWRLKDLGREFSERFKINYEKVYNFKTDLVEDMFGTGLYAWPSPLSDVYPPTEETFNHEVMFIKRAWFIFDNYIDTYLQDGGEFIKQLDSLYKLMDYGYRFSINQREAKIKQKFGSWRFIKRYFRQIWS